MQGYLQRLEQKIPGSRLAVMQSSGGTASAHQAGRYPVQLLLSGPAGGLKGAQYVAEKSGFDRLLTFDMGGTSTDVSIIDRRYRLYHRSPYRRLPGGGADGRHAHHRRRRRFHRQCRCRRPAAGRSRISRCRSRPGLLWQGWNVAAVTDANVVLGRLLPDAFLGGQMRLDKSRSEAAVDDIASALNMGRFEAANGIIDVVNDHMVRALRVMSVQRGENPKHYTLVSFGGAGGLHVCALADALQMQRALVPVNAGVLSALGMLAAEPSRERSITLQQVLAESDEKAIAEHYEQLRRTAEQELIEIAGGSEMQVEYSADLRYVGQSYTLNLPWSRPDALAQAFHRLHEAQYGHRMDIAVELVNLRVRLLGEKPAFDLPEWQPTEEAQAGVASVYGFDEPVSVYIRNALQVDQCIDGPALVTETTSTTWIDDGWQARVDRWGNILLHAINE